MASNYRNIKNVSYSIWKEDDDEDPSIKVNDAEVEELYFDSKMGVLYLSVIHDDRCIYIDVPILANNNWNDFVDSLPTWES